MLQVTGLEKRFGARTLFSNVSFTLTRGERLAIVGRNGTGKSTLFKVILGEESPDGGSVTMPRGYTVGHLSQHLNFQEPTILREACRGLRPGCEDEQYRGEIILSGLGFSMEDFERPASSFSGGFQIRVELARVLLSEPNLLLLDEPTNYLDIVSARWLEEFLRDWPNEIMMISHDRTFLDAVSTHTMAIHRGGARRVQGGTKKLYEIIDQDEVVYEQTRQNKEKKKRDLEEFIARNSARASTAAMAQSRVKQLEKLEIGDELIEEPVLDFQFTAAPFFGRFMLEVENLSFSYPPRDEDAKALEILKHFTMNVQKGDRIGIVGKNGRGKSTFLKLLAGELTPDDGEIRPAQATAIGYFGQMNIQRLSEKLTVEDEIMAANPKHSRTKTRAICGTVMFSGDDALKKIKVLSGGERSRVLLGKLLAQPTNLLLLDEPTNHLDVESIGALVESIEGYDGTVLLVTHDEYMLRKLAKRIVLFNETGAHLIEGDYDYFLEKFGWDDAEAISDSVVEGPSGSKSATNSKAARVERAQQRAEWQESVGAIVKQMTQVEKQIETLEQQVANAEQELLGVSSRGEHARAAELSKSIALKRKEIEAHFEKLTQLERERNAAEQQFG